MNKEFYDRTKNIVFYRIALWFLGTIDTSIFKLVDKVNDPKLKAYIPFRVFSQYLIEKGYDGIIYRSTRMNKVNLKGKNLVLFNKDHVTYMDGTMKKYKYSKGKYMEIKDTKINLSGS